MADINFNTMPIATNITANDTVHITTTANAHQRLQVQKLIDLAKQGALTDFQAKTLDKITSGCRIVFHTRNGGSLTSATCSQWTARQNASEVADGVLVLEGGRHLVVAPTVIGNVKWSDSEPTSVFPSSHPLFLSGDRAQWFSVFNGKETTDALLAHPSFASADSTWAAKACHEYSHGSIGAGKWWLPSSGEMLMILRNLKKIMLCMSLIDGASIYNSGLFWTSNERGDAYALHFYLNGNGRLTFTGGDKTMTNHTAIPVTSFA